MQLTWRAGNSDTNAAHFLHVQRHRAMQLVCVLEVGVTRGPKSIRVEESILDG